MVLSWVIFIIFVVSVAAGAVLGRIGAVSAAMLEGAASALTLMLSLAGPICLWSALQCTMECAGISRRLAKAFSPLLRLIYPKCARDTAAASAISQNLSANLLGLGNAATPMGIRAVQRMRELNGSDRASNEMCRLIVMNSASIQLIPTTIAAARATLGAEAPYSIIPAVWLSSLCSVTVGLLAARLMEHGEK